MVKANVTSVGKVKTEHSESLYYAMFREKFVSTFNVEFKAYFDKIIKKSGVARKDRKYKKENLNLHNINQRLAKQLLGAINETSMLYTENKEMSEESSKIKIRNEMLMFKVSKMKNDLNYAKVELENERFLHNITKNKVKILNEQLQVLHDRVQELQNA